MLDLLFAVWLFAMGAAVGSFLNVVIYRLPAGMSLVRPGSHCPRCGRPIRWHDNVPIFGWLMLRGRCRDCRAPISPRYPAIEAVTAALFLGLGTLEFLAGGVNLPVRPVALTDGLIYPSLGLGESGGLLAYHLLLSSTLLAAAMIQVDGQRQPPGLLVPALLVGGLAPLAWPHLHPVPAWVGPDGWLAGLVDGGAGLVVGLLMGVLVAWGVSTRWPFELVTVLGCVGLFLGWQAVAAVGMATAVLQLGARGLSHVWPAVGRIPPLMWLVLTTLLWLSAWKPLFTQWSLVR